MTNINVAVARLCTPARERFAMSAAGFVPSANAAAAAYTKLGARNDAQGARDAWSPPV
jgi:hypothetical protein